MDRSLFSKGKPEDARPKVTGGRKRRERIEAAPELVGPRPPRRHFPEPPETSHSLHRTGPTEVGITQPRGAFSDGVEDRLQVKSGAADDLQDLAYRRLLLERLFCLVEEPHIFDGDDGLIGECLEKLDLLRRERLDFHAADRDATDPDAMSQERH